MLEKNPDFTQTVGTVRENTSVFNGMTDTKMYTDSEKTSLSVDRPADDLQKQIYSVPNERLIWQDFSALTEGNQNDGSALMGGNQDGGNNNDNDNE